MCARLSRLRIRSSAVLSEIAKLVDAGKLKPVVETVLPLSDARRAHELGPPHRVRDCAHGRRNSLPAVELCQLSRSENTRRDQKYTFAALIHAGQFIIFSFCSPTQTTGVKSQV